MNTTNIQERIKKLMTGSSSESIFKQSTEGKTIIEKALNFFNEVYGLDAMKENLYRNLMSEEQINTLLIGPAATSKTLFMEIIRENCTNVIYYDATNSSGAGLISALDQHRSAKILLIDEIDKLKKNDQACLLGVLNDGTVSKTLKGVNINFKMTNLKVFATSNSSTKLSAPLKSRFEQYNLPQYTDEMFIKVVQHCLRGKFLEETSAMIAKILLTHEMKNVRAAIGVSKKIQKQDTMEDIVRVIENWIQFASNESVDYN